MHRYFHSHRPVISLALSTRHLADLVEKWADWSEIWKKGYIVGRCIGMGGSRCWRGLKHRHATYPLDVNDPIAVHITTKLLSAFTCYCGLVTWNVLQEHRCFDTCDACGRRIPSALLVCVGLTVGHANADSEIGILVCYFGCNTRCSICGAFMNKESGCYGVVSALTGGWKRGSLACEKCKQIRCDLRESFQFQKWQDVRYNYCTGISSTRIDSYSFEGLSFSLPICKVSNFIIQKYDPTSPRAEGDLPGDGPIGRQSAM